MASKKEALTQNTPLERLLAQGDLSALTSEQRADYYVAICASLELNPLTRPFEFITLGGKLVLYAKKDCTEQLRKLHKVSIEITDRSHTGDLFFVTAKATMSLGGLEQRFDESIGAVSLLNLKGDAAANAIMKAETKAKRRVTLSICGLGVLDETELETIPNIRPAEKLPQQEKDSVSTTPMLTTRLDDEGQIHTVPTGIAGKTRTEEISEARATANRPFKTPLSRAEANARAESDYAVPQDDEPTISADGEPEPPARTPQSPIYAHEIKILKDALAHLVTAGVYDGKAAAWSAFKQEFKVDGFDHLTLAQYETILPALRLKYVNRPPSRVEVKELIELLQKLVKADLYTNEVAACEDLRSIYDGKTIDQMNQKEVKEAIEICRNRLPVVPPVNEDDAPF